MATPQQEINSLKKDITQIKNLLEDQIEDSAANGMGKIEHAKQSLEEFASHAGKGVRAFVNDSSKQFVNAKDQCESTIKEHPFKSAAALLAGGMLLSALMRRK